jgi:aminoglycoside phosphotransferase (APT) family kinase protein
VDPTILAAPRLGGWRELAEHGCRDALRELDPWAAGHLDDLVALEEQAGPAIAGRTLLHGDLYPFNVLLTRQRVVVVDWPHAWIGAAHCDAVTLMSSAALSGIDPQPLAERHRLTRDVDPMLLDVFLALHAGFLFRVAVSAGPNADRHLLDMMIALGGASLRWLQNRR